MRGQGLTCVTMQKRVGTIVDTTDESAASTGGSEKRDLTTQVGLMTKHEEQEQSMASPDLDAHPPTKSEWPKSWIPDLNIALADRDILINPSARLSDAIINAAQKLLKRGNPSLPGLQNDNLGQTNSFTVQTGEFVQMLHTGQGHWHVVSTIGTKHPVANIFDSMFHFCSDHSKVQIASILATKEPGRANAVW